MPKSSRYQRSQNFTSLQITSKEIYSILISNIVNKPTSNIYFEKLFEYATLIYLSPRLATIDTTLRSFQYKILNNVLFLNKKLYTFGITNTALCSFCNAVEETPIHIFIDCVHVKCLWERLRMKLQNDFMLPSLTSQTAILGLYNEANWVGGKRIFCSFYLFICYFYYYYYLFVCFFIYICLFQLFQLIVYLVKICF